jgi:AcrR family transcriptional regulator
MSLTAEDTARVRILDAAETLFYARGIHGVGMDDIRNASGVSLKRLYREFPGKERVVEAFLQRRDVRWRSSLRAYVDAVADPRERPLAVFDWLQTWFAEPGFRGCAWINAYGELGGTSELVARLARDHKNAFRAYVEDLALNAESDRSTGRQLWLLAEGAMVAAAILGDTDHSAHARNAAAELMSRRFGQPTPTTAPGEPTRTLSPTRRAKHNSPNPSSGSL